MMEDLTLKAVNDSENGQTLLYGMGDQHLEVAVSKLLNRYKVEVELKKPKMHSGKRSARKQMWSTSIKSSPAVTDNMDTSR